MNVQICGVSFRGQESGLETGSDLFGGHSVERGEGERKRVPIVESEKSDMDLLAESFMPLEDLNGGIEERVKEIGKLFRKRQFSEIIKTLKRKERWGGMFESWLWCYYGVSLMKVEGVDRAKRYLLEKVREAKSDGERLILLSGLNACMTKFGDLRVILEGESEWTEGLDIDKGIREVLEMKGFPDFLYTYLAVKSTDVSRVGVMERVNVLVQGMSIFLGVLL